MTRNIKISIIFAGVVGFYIVATLGLETTQSNPFGWVLLSVGIGYSIAGTFKLAIAEYRERLADEDTDWWSSAGMLVICLTSALEYLYLPTSLPRNPVIQEAGILLFGVGLVIYLWARWISDWGGKIGTSDEGRDPVIWRETYRLVRYPVKAGLGLMALSVCLGYSSLGGTLAFLVILIPGMLYRLRSENKRMTNNIIK